LQRSRPVSHRSRQPAGGEAPGPDPLLGTSAGPFSLEAVVAAGGFGTVYRARGGPRGEAAVKVLHAELAGSAEAVARFEREVAVLGRLDHPGLVDILVVGRLGDGRPFFAMELLDGSDLEERIARDGRLSPAECLAVLGPVCEALAAAHDAGVVHRDIKATNVFLTRDGRPVLLDFGIAKLVDPASGAAGLTASRQALGTPSCMAPEQIAGRPATRLSDVYGLGALLYHMLAGEPPFADASPTVMQYLHAHARRPRVTARARVPDAIDDVVATAMALEPDRRHAGPREMLAAARAALAPAASPAATETRVALAVRVEVRLAPSPALDWGDEADLSAALDDADAVWTAARAHFCTRGFVPALEASESILFVRPLEQAGLAPALAAASAVPTRDQAAEFEQLIETRAGRHPSVTVTVVARSGEAAFAGNVPVGGPLLDHAPRPQRS
jgi:eukaryotic-like serine/threonine-protein kinase